MESPSLAQSVDRSAFNPRWCARAGLAALAVMLAWNLVSYAISAGQAINFPFELDYGEGIVWQQMRSLLSGKGYGPIDGLPAIVFHYPPVYHLGAGLLAALTGMDQLAAGRLLSIGSTIAIGGFIAASVAELANAPRQARGWIGGLLAALIALSTSSVQSWSFLMRVDMLSVAFTLAGFYFGLRSLARPGAIHLAALMFVVAIYTKQTAIAAPAAVFAILLLLRPRTALAGIATTLGLGLLGLGTLMWLTDGGFLRHILLYNINRFEWKHLLAIAQVLHAHLLYITAALFGIYRWLRSLPPRSFTAGGWQDLRQRLLSSPADAGYAMALVYLALTTLMLVLATKSGASINYFMEWSCVIAAFAGLALVDTVALAMGKPTAGKADAWVMLLPLLLASQVFFRLGEAGARYSYSSPYQKEFSRLAALVKTAPRPVISDNMVVVLRGGQPVIWEPAIFTELASKGVWDERPFIEKVKAHKFAFFITGGKPGDRLYDDRYSGPISQAIRTAYPVERHLVGYTIHFPEGPLPAYAADFR